MAFLLPNGGFMVSYPARPRTRLLDLPWRSVPVGLIVLVYVVGGIVWIFGSGPVTDMFAEATSIPRWVVELGKGLLFVVATAVVLQVVLRRHADRVDAAEARPRESSRQLTVSEDRNRLQATALSGTANGVVITGPDGTIEWVNAAFEAMSGYPASVAVGATPRLVSSGVQDEVFFRELWDTILAGQVWRGQVVNRRRDGELYTISQTITPVTGAGGDIQNFVAIQEDVTERVRAAEVLEAGRLRLQALFDHAVDAIVLTDEQGRYIEVNAAVCELTGYSRDELLGMRAAELAGPDQQHADAVTQFDAFVQAGTESGSFALRHKDGRIVETEYRSVSNIQPGVNLSILRDVTSRYTMLHALTLAEAQFRALAENAADIVAKVHLDADGRMQIDYVNPAATTILGYPQEQLYNDVELLRRLLPRADGDLDGALVLLPSPAEPITLNTIQVQRADGSLVWLEIHATLTDPSTVPVTIQLVARDATARLEMSQALEKALEDQLAAAEELRRLNAMKDTFLQSISHELRTPLSAILGFAQVLADPRRGLSPADTREFHLRLLHNAERLQRLLDDLLDVDRFARGHLQPDRQPTDLTTVIQTVIDDIDLGDHPVELDLEPITMDLDTPLIERVVDNLLRNIVRHTPPQTRIWIRTRTTAEGVELTVDDDGPGISEADRQRLIEPFQQGPKTTYSSQPGAGIGLALINAFAQLHGGDLAITDSPTGGTRMTVTLAHAETDTSPANREAPGLDTATHPTGNVLDVQRPGPADDAASAS